LLPAPIRWRALVLRGRLESTLGRRVDAARHYRSARLLINELAARIEDTALRQTFLSQASATLPRSRPEAQERALARERFGGLTKRECEVASLIALGRSNREIAEALVLSDRTVAVHVANALAKLGFQSRAQIASWATSNGLAGKE
jgi:DNA-binding NarL/FixJ family response regulator